MADNKRDNISPLRKVDSLSEILQGNNGPIALMKKECRPEAKDSNRKFTKPLREPLLGKYFALPTQTAAEPRIELDTSQSPIPVYSHLRIHESDDIKRPATPPVIARLESANYLIDYYGPKAVKNDKAPAVENSDTPSKSNKLVKTQTKGQPDSKAVKSPEKTKYATKPSILKKSKANEAVEKMSMEVKDIAQTTQPARIELAATKVSDNAGENIPHAESKIISFEEMQSILDDIDTREREVYRARKKLEATVLNTPIAGLTKSTPDSIDMELVTDIKESNIAEEVKSIIFRSADLPFEKEMLMPKPIISTSRLVKPNFDGPPSSAYLRAAEIVDSETTFVRSVSNYNLSNKADDKIEKEKDSADLTSE